MDSTTEKSTSEQITKIISLLSISPFQIVVYIGFAGVICNTFLEELFLNTISGVFFLLIPLVPLLYINRKKRIDDSSIPIGDRFTLLLIQIIGFSVASIIYYFYPLFTGLDTEILFIFVVGYTILQIISLVITSGLKHKISLHMTGASSSITALVMIFGWVWGLLYLFCIPIAWARVKLRSHTNAQVISGTAMGIVIIVLTYLGFWYIF